MINARFFCVTQRLYKPLKHCNGKSYIVVSLFFRIMTPETIRMHVKKYQTRELKSQPTRIREK